MINLNDEQENVVYCESKHIVCIAGAGSGKTTCMLSRIQRLIHDRNAHPESMLVLTFTHNAAIDMKARYDSEYDDLGSNAVPYFCTFHSFCYHILLHDKNVRSALGYSKIPDIVEDWEEKKYYDLATTLSGIKFNPNTNKELSVKEKYQLVNYEEQLQRLLISDNKITYDILSSKICKLFQNNDKFIINYKKKYDYIFVDEFQDTDMDQWNFVKSFEDSNIYVCGDALQNLYSFRGTTNEILKSLVNDPDWTTLKITKNYRSKKDIVDFVNSNSVYASDEYRIDMLATTDMSGHVDVSELFERKKNSNYLQNYETDYLTNDLKIDQVLYPGSFALLARTNSEVNYIESVLLSNEIEYEDTTSKNDVTRYFRCIDDDNFAIEWLSSFLASKQYDHFMQKNIVNTYTLEEFVNEFNDNSEISYRYDTIQKLDNILKNDNIDLYDMFQEIDKILNIVIDMSGLTNFSYSSVNNLIQYIENNIVDNRISSLFVGTIHSVKGLEFDSVVLFGVNDVAFKLDSEDNNNLYYVGITRAKNYLKVFRYNDQKVNQI